MQYIYILILFLAIELLYFKIADRFDIIDKPNNRSSHTTITLRGGGIIFVLAMLFAYGLGFVNWPVTLAVFLVGIISFIDDIKPIHQLPRLAIHCVAFFLIILDLSLFQEALWQLLILFVLFTGWVNAFNFMDGINGITVLYAIVALLTFAYLPINSDSLPLLFTIIISAVVFGIFNVRKKAKTFAGDVGSISMAVFLAYLMIKTIWGSGQIAYILFFVIYGIDAGITIITRLLKKENIFQPHRSHLYQYLANEMKFSHVLVASIYASLQLVVNVFLIYMESKGQLTIPFSLGILVFFSFLYLFIRMSVIRKVNNSISI